MQKKINFTQEILAHIPLCVYPYAKEVLLLSQDLELKKQVQKHGANIAQSLKEEAKIYDVCIVDEFRKSLIARIYRSLKDDGILVVKSSHWQSEEFKQQLQDLELFRFVIPFFYHDNTKLGQCGIFASKKYHPIAHLNLHIADLLEDAQVYNADMHRCFFTMPNYIYQDLKQFLKL